jgi:predicted phage gp36 major capsid-like protein
MLRARHHDELSFARQTGIMLFTTASSDSSASATVLRRGVWMTGAAIIGCAVAGGYTLVNAKTGLTSPLDRSPASIENAAAMSTMMKLMSVKPTADADRDFVAMMVPHHEGAIAMAQTELRHGHNEQLRRIAQEIIVTQQQEIIALRHALVQSPPSRDPAATGAMK